jgi:CelD/BcsL family acetyltransferase involved in cellulose biosynthesis
MRAAADRPPGPAPQHVEELVELQEDDPAWLQLVAAAPGATGFHLPAWTRTVADTYGYRTTVLADVDASGRVAAGLPLVRVRRPSGPAWVSLPFTDHTPPLARDEAGSRRLAAGLAGWSQRTGAQVEVRGELAQAPGWRDVRVGVRHVLPLEAGAEAARRGFNETCRRRLRQAERSGLRARIGRTSDDVEAFYRLHVLTRRRQGVPVQPHRLLHGIWERLIAAGHGVVVLVEAPAGPPVAGAVLLAWNGTATLKFQASDERCWEARPNHLCYWTALRWAAETGHCRFDFGRTESHHEGLLRWKAGWGAEAVPLTYALTGRGGSSVGDRGPLDAALRLVIRSSPPLVCRALGALLYRYAA